MSLRKIIGIAPAPTKPFRAALRHEANFYRPYRNAGSIIWRQARRIAEGQRPPRAERRPQQPCISRQDGWRYALASTAIVGFCIYAAALGDPDALLLLPIAAVPGILAYAGLRHSKR